jgi:4-methyl-5(b-hydroxyethyl)-thiazole monophosphate biosynthesis
MKVFIFLADGFEEIEAIAPIDIFRRANVEVVTVSISANKRVIGAHNVSVLADCLFSETDFSNNDLLFLPGGMPGTKNLDAHEGLKQLLQRQADKVKNIAAICAAPSILGKMNLLKDKEAICYPGFEDQLYGAILSKDKIVKSGNISTAKGAGVAIQFALKLVEELKGKETADKIAAAIQL